MVRDPAVRRAVLGEVVEGLADAGLVVSAVVRSPLTGADGNVEFLVSVARTGTPVGVAALDLVAPTEPEVVA